MLLAISLMSVPIFADDTQTAPPGSAPKTDDMYSLVRLQLPPAPDGFDWNFFENAGFPKPRGWFEHSSLINAGGVTSDTYAASPKDFSAANPFETGFTVNRFANLEKFQKPKPSQSTIMMIKIVMASHQKEDIKYFSHSQKGDFDVTYFRYRDAPPGQTPEIIHQFYLANDTTDNLDVFIFESPEDQWDRNWTLFGAPMLSKTFVIPSFPNN